MELKARQILDSRGIPTIEVDCKVKNTTIRTSVPAGASKGKYEVPENRDHKKAFHGKGVQKAVDIINKQISPLLKGKKLTQQELDEFLIGLDKNKVGANTTLAVSLAHYKTMPQKRTNFKPTLMANLINGGSHAGNNLRIQEHMIVPLNTKTNTEAIQIITETYQALKEILQKKYSRLAINVGDEGGFAPPVKTTEEACELLMKALEEGGYQKKVKIALDVAASGLYKQNKYYLEKAYTKKELIGYYKNLEKTYPIYSIEDPFEENDFQSFTELTKTLKAKVVTDDLTVTNSLRIQKAIKEKAGNAIIIKPNQIGTMTETLQAIQKAKKAGWTTIISHRSGETNDPFIVQLAQETKSHLKLGAPCRGERIAKYNQLLRNEE